MGGKNDGLTVDDLLACSPAAIEAVAATWERLGTAMDGDKGRLETEILTPLRASWISDDGRRAVRLIGYVGDQLQAVRQESGALASILREAAAELRAAQGDVHRALDDVTRNGMTRHQDGRISWQTTTPSQQDMLTTTAGDIANRIATALRRATDADTLAALTIKANVDFLKRGAKNNFNDWALGADPAADARRTADILNRLTRGEKLTAEELQFLHLLDQDNKTDLTYQTSLLRDLTPAGLLAVTRTTVQPWLVPGMKLDDLAYIQQTLRTALSAASPTLAADTAWMDQLKAAGRDIHADPKQPLAGQFTHGYQLLDPLLRQGTYDSKFLTIVGDDIILRDKELAARHTGWHTTDPARDPVSGFLVALKNNPQAATEFFSTQTDAHGAITRDGAAGLRYLLTDRKLAAGPLEPQSNANAHLAPLGDAIVAATTGRPTTQPMVDVVETVVTTLGTKGSSGALAASPELRFDVTDMLARNPESLHLALTQESATKDLTAIPETAPTANIAREAMQRVLAELVAETGNIETLKQAEGLYAGAGLSLTLATPGLTDAHVYTFAKDAGEAFGVLDASIAEAIRDEGLSQKDAKTLSEGRAERWISYAETTGFSAIALSRTLAATPAAPVSPWVGFLLGASGGGVNGMVGEFFDLSPPSDPSPARVHDVYVDGQIQAEAIMRAWQEQSGFTGPSLVSAVGDGYGPVLNSDLRPQ